MRCHGKASLFSFLLQQIFLSAPYGPHTWLGVEDSLKNQLDEIPSLLVLDYKALSA